MNALKTGIFYRIAFIRRMGAFGDCSQGNLRIVHLENVCLENGQSENGRLLRQNI
jgi:hypothetical protein